MQSLTLDAFVILILILLAFLGFMRGGLREVCSAAGLLFGVAVVSQWDGSLGGWLARAVSIDEGAARFLSAVFILLVCAMICGYGAGSAFVYQPSAGGRMYGGLLGLLIGVVFVGYIINYVQMYLLDGKYPEVVTSSYVARALSVGIDWVLLAVAGIVVLATAFGLLVREQAPDQYIQAFRPVAPDLGYGPPATDAQPKPRPVTTTDKVEPIPAQASQERPPVMADDQTAPMRIREVRHWEEPATPPVELNSGWTQTWPVSATGTPPKPPWDNSAPRRRQQSPPAGERPQSPPMTRPPQPKPRNDAEVLREWLAEDDGTPARERPPKDE